MNKCPRMKKLGVYPEEQKLFISEIIKFNKRYLVGTFLVFHNM